MRFALPRRLRSKERPVNEYPSLRRFYRPMLEPLENRVAPAALNIVASYKALADVPQLAAIKATINTAIQLYENFTTVPNPNGDIVYVSFAPEPDSGPNSNDVGSNLNTMSPYPYPAYLAALNQYSSGDANDTSALAALNAQGNILPTGVYGQAVASNEIWLRPALARALNMPGAPPANANTSEVIYVNFAKMNITRPDSNLANYDLQATVLHELDEVLTGSSALDGSSIGGPIPTSFGIEPLDLFRYTKNGNTPTLIFNTTFTPTYFSINGGQSPVTRNALFYTASGGDWGDWFNQFTSVVQVQDHAIAPGAMPNLGQDELTRLDVLGYNLNPNLPDLTLKMSNSVNGAVMGSVPWTWTLQVTNQGSGTANFADTQTIVADNLPDLNIGYTHQTFTENGGAAGTCTLSITNDNLKLTATGPVSIPVGGTITITFTATPTAGGSFANPRPNGIAAVDPYGVIAESNYNNHANNSASDVVAVSNASMVANLGDLANSPGSFVQAGSYVYFVATVVNSVPELWETGPGSNGTQTNLVTDADGNNINDPSDLTVVNGTLYFVADDPSSLLLASGVTLTVSQQFQTDPGDTQILTVPAGTTGSFTLSYDTATTAPIAADDPNLAADLQTDLQAILSATDFTVAVTDNDDNTYTINLFTSIDPIWPLTVDTGTSSVVPGAFYSSAVNTFPTVAVQRLYACTGTIAQIVPIGGDPNNPPDPYDLTAMDGNLYFAATDSTGQTSLWSCTSTTVSGTTTYSTTEISIPTTNGTIEEGDGTQYGSYYNPEPTHLTAVGTTLYFTAYDGTYGAISNPGPEPNPCLYSYTGGSSATEIPITVAQPISGGAYIDQDPNPQQLTAVGTTTLYFAAYDATQGAEELWDYNGTTITAPTEIPLPMTTMFDPAQMKGIGNTLFFTLPNSSGDQVLPYTYNGTTVSLLTASSYSQFATFDFTAVGDDVDYLTVSGSGPATYQLWTYNGIIATPVTGASFPVNVGTDPIYGLSAVGSVLFYAAIDRNSNMQLWSYDGTDPPAVVRINPNGPSFPENLSALGNSLYLGANDGTHGDQPWVVTFGNKLNFTTAPNINNANVDGVTVTGTGVNGDMVSVTITDGTTTTTSATQYVTSGTWSVTGIDATGLSDGPVTYAVTETDPYGNTVATVMQGATKLLTPPAVAFTSTPNITPATASNITATGTGDSGDTISVTITDGNNTTTAVTTTVEDGTWSVSGINALLLNTGQVTYIAVETDAVGNTTPIAQSAYKQGASGILITQNTANVSASAASLVINGSGFDPSPINDAVTLSSGTATVLKATATALTISFSGVSVGALEASVADDGLVSLSTQIGFVLPAITKSTASIGNNATSLTINGFGFDTTAGNDVLTLNGVIVPVNTATNNQLIVTSLPTLAFGSITAAVVVDSVSNGAAVQVATVASAITFNAAEIQANTSSLIIQGVGFSSTKTDDVVKFLDGTKGTVSQASPTQLNITGITGLVGGNLLATVTVSGTTSASTEVATVQPLVTSSAANLPANQTLVIHGVGFSATASDNQVAFSDGATGTVTSATATTLTVTGLSGFIAGSVNVIATTGGVASTSTPIATVTPVITKSTASLGVDATTLTINGFGFDPNPANDVLTLGGVTVSVDSATPTQLTVTSLPTLTAGSLTASVVVEGQSSGTPVQVQTVTAAITSNPAEVLATATTLTIQGAGFSATSADDIVKFTGGAVGTVSDDSPTQLTITNLHGLIAGNLFATITIGSLTSPSIEVAIVQPVVSIGTTQIAASPTSLVVKGTGFSGTAKNDTVQFSNGATGTVTSASATSLTVTGIKGLVGGSLTATVTSNNVSSIAGVQVAIVLLAAPKPAVSNVSATQFTLTWNLVPGATSYEIDLQQPNGSWSSLVTVGGDTNGQIFNAQADSSYTFRVDAINAATTTSSASVKALTETIAPTVTYTTAAVTQINWVWTLSLDATAYVLRIFQDGAWVTVETVGSNVTTASTIEQPGVTNYQVYAVNGHSAYSLKLTTQTATEITLNWSAVPGATGYEVDELISGSWKKISTLASSAVKAIVTATPGTTVTFRVGAINSAGTDYSTNVVVSA
jgi:hypothetical protein